jgi:hypothetical protein
MQANDMPAISASKPIFIYAEAPPLDENIPSHGLYRAGTPIITSILDHVAQVALYPVDRRYRLPQVAPMLRPISRSLPLLFTLFRAFRKRFLASDFENGLVAMIVARWARRCSASHILVLEGSDPEVLARAARIAAKAKKSLSVYLVDDFEWTMRLHGSSESDIACVTTQVHEILSRTTNVFAITDELGEWLRTRFGVSPVTLPLAFDPKPRPAMPVKDQIFFLGSVNFLYADALRTLIDAVAHTRADTGRNLTIRFTSANGIEDLGVLPEFVTVAPIEGAEALAREISASLFAFLPYSFDERLKAMVTTSFPSKSMEYLAYARSIAVYAPPYSNSSQLFNRAGLPSVTASRAELQRLIASHLESPPDHHAKYRDYLERFHAPAAIRKIILDTLDLR